MKKERRSYYRSLQGSFSSEQYERWNRDLAQHLISAIRKIPPQALVAVYQPRPKEADLSPLFSENYRFCFPKVLSIEGEMEFRCVHPVTHEQFTRGAFGILEPRAENLLVKKNEIAVCFIPLLAFDAAGRRLGQGKGFYDRFLEGFTGKKIGVAFEWQFSPEPLPVEAHDERLDQIVTEFGIRDFSKN